MREQVAALLTQAWVKAEGEHFWRNPANFRIPREGVKEPNPNKDSDWTQLRREKVVLDAYRLFFKSLEKDFAGVTPKKGGRTRQVETEE